MSLVCMDYAQYTDLRALLGAEAERREQISTLWFDQVNECGYFYMKRGDAIVKREKAAARALFLQMLNESKVKPRELSIEEKEYFKRCSLIIDEEESRERIQLQFRSSIKAHEIAHIFQQCITQHYKFSLDLHNYFEVRRPTAEDLDSIKPEDRHLPRDLLTRLKQKRRMHRLENMKPLERLEGVQLDCEE